MTAQPDFSALFTASPYPYLLIDTGLRAEPASSHAVLVAVTGYGQEQYRAQTAAAGFDHHLVKPVDIARLQAILAAVATTAP